MKFICDIGVHPWLTFLAEARVSSQARRMKTLTTSRRAGDSAPYLRNELASDPDNSISSHSRQKPGRFAGVRRLFEGKCKLDERRLAECSPKKRDPQRQAK